jgi:hypothetical protein
MKNRVDRLAWALAVVTLPAVALAEDAPGWPQWGGPDRNGSRGRDR